MARGRTKEILHTSRFITSPGRRQCWADKKNHSIERGTTCLTIKDGLGNKSYCLECAGVILKRGKLKVDLLLTKLEALLH